MERLLPARFHSGAAPWLPTGMAPGSTRPQGLEALAWANGQAALRHPQYPQAMMGPT
jgi:hypothetical protein